MTTRRVFVAIALTFTACARAPKPAAPHLPDAARSKVSSINDAKAEAALAESTPEGRAYEKGSCCMVRAPQSRRPPTNAALLLWSVLTRGTTWSFS